MALEYYLGRRTLDDRKLHTVDFIERFMGGLSWLLACLQMGFVIYTLIQAPYFITWQWVVQRLGLLATVILYGIFFSTSNKNFRPIFLSYGICAMAISIIPDVYESIAGFTRVFSETVFTSYSLFEFLYYCKHCFVFAFALGLGYFMVKSRGLINGRIENCCLLLMVSAVIGQIYTTLYLLSNNVVLTAYYNLHIGFMAICLLIPAVYILYCCDESFGGVPTLS